MRRLIILESIAVLFAVSFFAFAEEKKSEEIVLSLRVNKETKAPADMSGYKNKVINHGAKVVSDDKFGQVMEFDGKDNWIEIPVSDNLKISGDITWEILMRVREDLPESEETLISYGEPTKLPYMHIRCWDEDFLWTHIKGPGTDFYYELLDTDGNRMFYGGDIAAAQPTPGWHLVTLVRAGNNLSFYVDGNWAFVKKSKKFGDISPQDACYHIGRDGIGKFYYKGMLGEVRIYKRAISEEEISKRAKSLPLDPIVED